VGGAALFDAGAAANTTEIVVKNTSATGKHI